MEEVAIHRNTKATEEVFCKSYSINAFIEITCIALQLCNHFPPTGGVNRCGQLSSVKHGSFTIENCANPSEEIHGRSDVNCTQNDNYATGSVASYRCEKYYELLGPEFRTCERNGEWTGNIPICEPGRYHLPSYAMITRHRVAISESVYMYCSTRSMWEEGKSNSTFKRRKPIRNWRMAVAGSHLWRQEKWCHLWRGTH